MQILTIHYNTPLLVECLVRSVRKYTDCTVYVFDNSDQEPFKKEMENVRVIDNTKGQVVNFDTFLQQFPERKPGLFSSFGSAIHTKSVDACFDLLPEGFILMDSDVLIKKDFTWMWNEECAWVGELKNDGPKGVYLTQLLPFLCYINVPMCREYGIRYFNGEWMWNLTPQLPNTLFDTGAWFIHEAVLLGLPYKETKVFDYIEHFGHGSHEFLNIDYYDWLVEHSYLWGKGKENG